jgi:hypothetical protein
VNGNIPWIQEVIMVSLTALWLPILLSAVGVFIVSSIIHMLLRFHKGEYGKLPGEANILEAMRKEGVSRGEYMFPCADSLKESSTPEMQEKFKQGPVGLMVVMPDGTPSMGKSLVTWFLYSIMVGIFVAYITSRTLPAGSEYLAVFRIAGAVAFIAYSVAHASNSIWKGVPWSSTFKHAVDGLVYGLVTGGFFGWLWPSL